MRPARSTILHEVTILSDARGHRPENAVGIGMFWYEPEIWSLPINPAAKVLYTGLCSHLGHGQIHRRDLREALKGSTEEEVAAALGELVGRGLLAPSRERAAGTACYEVRSVNRPED